MISEDPHDGIEVARRLRTGIVHVNDQTVADEPQAPFGRIQDSGYGTFAAHAERGGELRGKRTDEPAWGTHDVLRALTQLAAEHEQGAHPRGARSRPAPGPPGPPLGGRWARAGPAPRRLR